MKTVILIAALSIVATAGEGEYGTHLGSGQVEANVGVQYIRDTTVRPYLGATYRAGLTRWLSGYFDIGQQHERFVVGSARVFTYGGGLQFSAPIARVEPYVVAGIGGTRISRNVQAFGFDVDLPPEHFLTPQAGGGVRVYLTRNMGVSGEYRALKMIDYEWMHRGTVGVFWHVPRSPK